MHRIRILTTVPFVALMLLSGGVSRAETLTTAGVIEMHKIGMSETLIIQKIRSSNCDFDTSVAGLKALKESDVPESIISAMLAVRSPSVSPPGELSAVAGDLDDPLVMRDTGLWLYRETATKKMVKLAPWNAGRSSGWNKKSRAVLPGASAVAQLNSARPVFYYYAPAPNRDDEFAVTGPSDPQQLILARMEVRADKNERRLAVGKEGFFGDKKSGLESKSFVATTVEKVGDRVFRIVPAQDLSSGEYGFIWADQASRDALKHRQVELYDFGIRTAR